MKKAIITVGCSASGKSTYAKELVKDSWVELNRDNYRKLILCVKFEDYNINQDLINMWSLWKFKWEDSVKEMFEKGLESNLDKNIIISDTNLNKDKREALIKRLEGLGYEVEVKVFGQELSIDELWKRDEHRLNTVGRDVIARQYYQFRKEFPKYQLKDVSNKPKAVIFDIDGSITLGPENRSPYEWDKVSQDKPNPLSIMIVNQLIKSDYQIIFMSGRDEICREDTIKWISDNTDIEQKEVDNKLFMRKIGDMRKDTVVKLEMFFSNIDGNYNVEYCIEDRPCVYRQYLDLGITPFFVGNSYLEF